jgi:hypothetical protein
VLEEHNNDNDDHLAVIWRSAEHRRSDDIHSFLKQFLKTRRQLKSSKPRRRYFVAQVTSSIWKLLDAARTGSRISGKSLSGSE